MGGVAGRNPGRGGASGAGTGGVITGGSAGIGGTPKGGSFPGGSAGSAGGGQTGSAGAGGSTGAGECKNFCASITRWCERVGSNPATCFKDCYAAFSSPQVSCRQETLDAMNCAAKAISSLPGDRCVSTAEITRYCAAELTRQAMCEASPAPIPAPLPTPAPDCIESGSSTPDSCVWVRQCGVGDYALLECRQPTPGTGANCECWVNGSLRFATTAAPDWPAEKVCFDPAVNSACQTF
jgi:hypothetical protein